MPIVPQITNPLQGKGYNSTTLNNQQRPGGEQFEIIQLTKPQSAKDTAEREAGRQQLTSDRKDLLPMSVKTPKDPTMAVETLKQLINSDLLATAKANGYTQLYGELEQLSKSIYLSVDELVRELLNQEKMTTMFSNHELFDLLRNLAGRAVTSGNEDMSNAIGNFLKAVNFTLNRDEIMKAISSNMKFLSDYFSPSQSLSEQLGNLSKLWASPEARTMFETLKLETLSLLHNVSESLLNNEKTQVLLPLIVHNMSRYNTNDYMLRDYFSALLMHVPHNMRNEFTSAFDKLLASLNMFQGGGEQNQQGLQNSEMLNQAAQNSAQDTVFNNDTTKQEINQALFHKENAFPSLLGEKLASGMSLHLLEMSQDTISNGLRNFLLGRISGMDALYSTLATLAGDDSLLSALRNDLLKADSITMLVDYLNDILKQLPDMPERQTLFQILSEIIAEMAEKGELPPEAQKGQASDKQAQQMQQTPGKSSLEELTGFIEKNINHAALKTLHSYNASNLLQSLINAPGVFTPLAHYIIPLQIGNTCAFGEVWVDNDEKNASAGASGGKKNFHLFLTFEVETVGRFETDVYASGNEINLALLYPESFKTEIKAIKDKVARLIADTGYAVREFRTGVLKEPHDLTQIFPRITEKRTGLDVIV